MTALKTQENDASVTDYLETVQPERRRRESLVLLEMMRRVTGCAPRMWGSSIVGFDRYAYKYDSGREGEWFVTGFAPRKQAMTVYVMPGFSRYDALVARLGKHKTGKSCLYVNKLEDIDETVLEELVRRGYADMKAEYA